MRRVVRHARARTRARSHESAQARNSQDRRQSLPRRGHRLRFSPDGKTLAIASDEKIRLLDPATGSERLVLLHLSKSVAKSTTATRQDVVEFALPRSSGLGSHLATAAVAKILAVPDQWPQYLLGTKYVPLKRFPYFIVYRELGDELQVVAIAHSKRRRGYWRKRVL